MRACAATASGFAFVLLVAVSAGRAFGDDAAFHHAMSEARTAAEKGEFSTAMDHYLAAFRATPTAALKTEAAFALNALLLRQKKWDEARTVLKDLLKEPWLAPAVRRRTLRMLAEQHMWGSVDQAKEYIEMATTIPTTDLDEQFQTRSVIGYIYRIRKQPEHALEVWVPLMDVRGGIHPARKSSIGQEIGAVYRQLGDLDNARRYYELSLHYGKQVQYAFDVSAAEKALAELDPKPTQEAP